MNSILTSVKQLLGIEDNYTEFDTDIIIHINAVFMILRQVGVGPVNGFTISDKYANWTEFLPKEDPNHEAVKSYMYAKVRLMFDPPASSILKECLQKTVDELEWRLNIEVETYSESQ